MPTTVVYMPELSVHGLLAGLRSGRVFVDVEGTRDRILNLTAKAGTQQAEMGGTLRLRAGDSTDLTVEVKGVSSGVLQLIVDGESDGARRVAFAGDVSLSLSPWRADGRAHWLRADVRDGQGRLLLVGNPVYVEAAL